MVKVVRTPETAKRMFTPNELCGWTDGIKYSFAIKKKRRRKMHFVPEQPAPPVQIVSGGKPVPAVKLPF